MFYALNDFEVRMDEHDDEKYVRALGIFTDKLGAVGKEMLNSLTIDLGRIDSFVRVETAVQRLCWQALPQVPVLHMSIRAK